MVIELGWEMVKEETVTVNIYVELDAVTAKYVSNLTNYNFSMFRNSNHAAIVPLYANKCHKGLTHLPVEHSATTFYIAYTAYGTFQLEEDLASQYGPG